MQQLQFTNIIKLNSDKLKAEHELIVLQVDCATKFTIKFRLKLLHEHLEASSLFVEGLDVIVDLPLVHFDHLISSLSRHLNIDLTWGGRLPLNFGLEVKRVSA